jgi:type I restriction enzyme S subunit
MKNGWKMVPMSTLCSIKSGKSNAEDAEDNGQYVFFDRSKKVKRSTRYLYDCEALIIPGEGAEFLPRHFIGKFDLHQRAYALFDFSKNLDVRFLFYYLTHFKDYFVKVAVGATVKSLRLRHFEQLPVPVPSLPEQQRIVGILDEAFEGIATAKANAEKNLQNGRAIFESHLQSVFTQRGEGWVEKRLAELCDIKHGFAFKSEFFTDHGEYVVLTPGNFYESGGYRDRGEKQKYYCGEIDGAYVLEKGNLLVAMTEQAAGLLGSPILVPESNRFLHNQRLGLVVKKQGVPWTNEFFFHVFNTREVRKAIHDDASGVKVRHTSPGKIGELLVAFPTSVSEQRKIVSVLAELDEETQRLESICRRKLAALEALKKSLLHQAFAGELASHPEQSLQEAVA